MKVKVVMVNLSHKQKDKDQGEIQGVQKKTKNNIGGLK
jgi:hypothetical protein